MNASKPRRPRSPAVPSRNLEDAFADTKRLYNTYTHGTFSKSELASALGVSATSGPFAGRFFSLKEYGLVDGANDSFRVSQRFIGMKDEPTTGATFKRSALDAIRSSAIFAELLSDWKTKLPPREAVATRLEQQKKFNPDRAKEIAAVLEESLRFAGVLDASNNILPIRDDGDAGGGDIARDDDPDDDGRRDDVEHGKHGAHLRTDVPVGDGRRVIVSYPNDLTEQEAQKVGNVLKAIVA
jgi:hypothetical protein